MTRHDIFQGFKSSKIKNKKEPVIELPFDKIVKKCGDLIKKLDSEQEFMSMQKDRKLVDEILKLSLDLESMINYAKSFEQKDE
jgi:hypothetical protein